MNQFPQVMLPTMGMTPQFAPGTMMPGTGMMLPPPPIGLHLGMSPGKAGYLYVLKRCNGWALIGIIVHS